MGDLTLRGFLTPVPTFNILSLKEDRTRLGHQQGFGRGS